MLAPLCALVGAWAAAYGISCTRRISYAASDALARFGWAGFAAPGAMSLESDVLNACPAEFVRRTGQRAFLRAAYDAGVVAAGILMLCASAIVSVGAAQTILPLTRSSPLQRRDSLLFPVVPGATVPLSHAFPLVLTALLGQLVHECGHALAAAVDGIAPMRVGAMLVFPFVPIAYVVLPHVRRGTPERRKSALRIVAAGVWHNVLFLGLLWLLASAAQLLFVDARGLLVEKAGTGLEPWAPAGSNVIALGDRNISDASMDDRLALWHAFRAGDSLDRGRCVPAGQWSNAPFACCDTTSDTLACFHDGSAGRCLDPVSTYANLPPCGPGCTGTCAKALPSEHLSHVTVEDRHEARIVVIRGTFSVTVSTNTLRPALRALVGRGAADVFVYYTRIWYWYALVSGLALCLFNMLPIPGLDGSAFLRLVLEGHAAGRLYDDVALADDVEDPITPEERATDHFAVHAQRIIERAAICVSVLALIGSLISLL